MCNVIVIVKNQTQDFSTNVHHFPLAKSFDFC